MNLTPGTKLGPYEIVSPLGAGGMGEVYRAKDTRLGREVAIKVLPQHLSSNPEVRARFEREAKTVSSLNHPNICTLFDVGREGDTDFLVMELVEGETLATRLAKGALPTDQVLAIGEQVADALSRAHRAGIVHRDLKPGNIMLTKSGAKLMDFGLARAAGLAPTPGSGASIEALTQSPTVAQPLTAEGTIVGTFQYMSPEQLEGKEADERSDIWALGCVLYEMATGRRAFDGKSQASLIAAIMEHEPAPIADLQPMAPPALDRLVRSCLAKDPDDRVQTAHDVRLQIGWVRTDTSGSAPAAAVARPSGKRRTRYTLAWLAAVVAVAAVAFVAGHRGAVREVRPAGQYDQKTFQTQAIFTARFMPDGRTLVLSAALKGNRPELFVIRPEYPEPQPLGKKDVHLLAVSSRGELAVLTRARFTAHHRLFSGTLARMPLEGAAPRELMDDVREADWSPDGEQLAIIHDVGGSDRLEYPPGTVLHESAGYVSDVRVSPRGDLIAFMEHPARFDDRGAVCVVDLSGKVREISSGYWGLEGMAWAPDGKALYYSGGRSGGLFSVYRATLDGDARLVSDNAGVMTIHDIAPDGTWAVTRDDSPTHLLFRAAGSNRDVDLSWLDGALGPVLSADGTTLFFTDQSRAAGPNYGVAMRPTAGGPIVRLGEGFAEQVSSDEKFVLVTVPSTPPRLMKYPVGTGQSVRLDHGEFQNLGGAAWLPDETRILVSGNIAGQPPRCFILDPAGGKLTPVGPEGILEGLPAPDGKTFIARTKTGWSIFPLSGEGEGRAVTSMTPDDNLIRFNLDGSAVFTTHRNEIPTAISRIDLTTGKRETTMMLGDVNSAGLVSVFAASMADDLRSIAYATWNYTSVLFTVTTGHQE